VNRYDRFPASHSTYNPEFRKWEDSGSPNRPYYLGFNECRERRSSRKKSQVAGKFLL